MSVSICHITKQVTGLLLSVYVLYQCFQLVTQFTLAIYFWSHKNVSEYSQTHITTRKPATLTLNLRVFCDRVFWSVVGSRKPLPANMMLLLVWNCKSKHPKNLNKRTKFTFANILIMAYMVIYFTYQKYYLNATQGVLKCMRPI